MQGCNLFTATGKGWRSYLHMLQRIEKIGNKVLEAVWIAHFPNPTELPNNSRSDKTVCGL